MTQAKSSPDRAIELFCFAIVYLVWGSTFLAIRLSVETMPPLLVGGFRHFFGGLLLLLGLWSYLPVRFEWRAWRNALVVGSLTAGIANGALIAVERTVPSGIAAVSFTAMPVVLLILNWIGFERKKPTRMELLALVVALSGTTLVLLTGRSFLGTHFNLMELTLLVSCPLFWALGSLLGRKMVVPKSNLVNAALQMLGGGSLLFFLATLHGDWSTLGEGGVSSTSVWSVLYLTFFGSLLGYSAFAYLMKNVDPQLAGTYAFINPVVAVGLGLLWGERILTPAISLGSALSIVGVAILVLSKRRLSSLRVRRSWRSRTKQSTDVARLEH